MPLTRRQLTLALAALPAGCTIQPLPRLRSEAAARPAVLPMLRAPAAGQQWVYHRYNGYNGALLTEEEHTVVSVSPQVRIRHQARGASTHGEEVQLAGGRLIQRDLAWDHPQNYAPALPLWPEALTPDITHVHWGHYEIDGFSYRNWINQHTRVRGWEHVQVPHGRMLTLRVEHFIRLQHHDMTRVETTRRDTLWLAPEIGRWVAREITGDYLVLGDTAGFRSREEHQRWELVSWS